MQYKTYSYRFAEEVLNSKFSLKKEITDIIVALTPDYRTLNRPTFNNIFEEEFKAKGWNTQPPVFNEPGDPSAKMDFLKERIGIVLKTLSYREREIIKLRYGIGDGYTYTLEEVGRIFKVTRERVRQVEAKAIRKMQHPIRARKLEGFLDHKSI